LQFGLFDLGRLEKLILKRVIDHTRVSRLRQRYDDEGFGSLLVMSAIGSGLVVGFAAALLLLW
jgi:hypothetical protein